MVTMKKQVFALSVGLLFLVIAFTGCLEDSWNKSQVRVIYVDDDGGRDYTSIQAAINNADDGDSIIVLEGTYDELLRVDKPVSLKGSEGTVIIPKNIVLNENSTIVVTVDNCRIEGFTIIGNIFETDIIGINVYSSNNMIIDNSISWVEYGVYMDSDVDGYVFSGNNISGNVISNCTYGIYVHSDAKNNTIYNNDIIDNSEGIYLYYCVNNSIIENYVYSNTVYGIYIGLYSDGNVVSRNVCTENRYGIRFKGVSDNEIFLNRLERNEMGLYSCCSSSDNILYYNTLIDNDLHASDGFSNFWDNGIVGNYWEDYTVIYPNATQIDNYWSIPYDVPMGDNVDNFPLVNPFI